MSGSVQTTGIPNYKKDFRWLAKSAHVSLSNYASLNSSHLCLWPVNHPPCFDSPVDLRAAQDTALVNTSCQTFLLGLFYTLEQFTEQIYHAGLPNRHARHWARNKQVKGGDIGDTLGYYCY